LLPTAGVNRVFGLLDLLRAYNGKTDVAHLTIDLRIDLDELLPIIDTAEYMGLVAIQHGDISLTDLGKKALNGKIPERKKLVHDRLVGIEPFTEVIRIIQEKKQLSRFELARFVSSKYGYTTELPTIINVIISWGVFTGLFRYDGQSESLLPREESR
jgi:NitT/TauT family transport system ATP-binding protein